MHRFGSVALIGRPNAGKSTLLNRLVGEKIAIVTDRPQTTRTGIMGIVNGEDWQMLIRDAPGIHKPKDRLGVHMMHSALGGLDDADVIYYLVDASGSFGGGEAYILRLLEKTVKPVFLLLNKVDLLDKQKLLPLIAGYHEKRKFAHIIPISALAGDNIPALLQATVEYFPEGPPVYPRDEMTDQPERIMAAEMIREKAILAAREEVPYALAVVIEKMERRREDLLDIYAAIVVEQAGQKAILIGKKGSVLKKIGTEARKDIEDLLGLPVNLRLWVRVREDWRNKETQLREFIKF